MKMKPEEITAIIKKQIEDYNVEMNVDDVGPGSRGRHSAYIRFG